MKNESPIGRIGKIKPEVGNLSEERLRLSEENSQMLNHLRKGFSSTKKKPRNINENELESFSPKPPLSAMTTKVEERAAIVIQRHIRGFLQRYTYQNRALNYYMSMTKLSSEARVATEELRSITDENQTLLEKKNKLLAEIEACNSARKNEDAYLNSTDLDRRLNLIHNSNEADFFLDPEEEKRWREDIKSTAKKMYRRLLEEEWNLLRDSSTSWILPL